MWEKEKHIQEYPLMYLWVKEPLGCALNVYSFFKFFKINWHYFNVNKPSKYLNTKQIKSKDFYSEILFIFWDLNVLVSKNKVISLKSGAAFTLIDWPESWNLKYSRF